MCALKILNVQQIREADAYTIAHEPIASIQLMERAAAACFYWIRKMAGKEAGFKVLCGMGNNGGDGLAVARMLQNDGFDTEVMVIRHSKNVTDDFQINFNLLADTDGIVITDIYETDPQIELSSRDIVIDAILGSGLNKPVSGFIAQVIHQVNKSNALVISIDMPSGLFADSCSDPRRQAIVQADYTLTFQMPKLALLMAENEPFIGQWEVLDIGLHPEYLQKEACSHFLTERRDCSLIYRPRPLFAHKGNFGHGLLIAGSTGKMGAAVMAAKACLRSGAGLLTAHVPGDGFLIMQSSIHEAMVSIDPADSCFSALPVLDNYNAIAVGPGLGNDPGTQAALKLLIQQTTVPLIIDADALNILANNKTWISFLPPGSILTPHPGEFERLAGATENQFDRLELLKIMAERYKIYIVLKGAFTAVACPDGNVYFNPTGNPGMAKGGSGDALTGVLLGLMASGYTPGQSCILGTWLHGYAGDLAARKFSTESMLTSDLIDMLGKAFRKISR